MPCMGSYQLLGLAASGTKPVYIREWEKYLGREFSGAQLAHLYQLTHSSSTESRTLETNYKILTCWYRVPAVLSRIYSSISDRCWRGCGLCGTLLHLWWECLRIRLFWEEIKTQIQDILGIDIPFFLLHFLFHISPMPVSQYRKSTLPHFLNAAKRLLPIYWNQTHVPGQEEWTRKVKEIREAEEWVTTCNGTRESFNTTWALG